MLIGYFWDVEHKALYKPSPELKGISERPKMKRLYDNVLIALDEFETVFENYVKSSKDT